MCHQCVMRKTNIIILVIFIILSANFLYKFFYNKEQELAKERRNNYINEIQKEKIEKILNINKEKILESLNKDKAEGGISDEEFDKAIEVLNKIK